MKEQLTASEHLKLIDLMNRGREAQSIVEQCQREMLALLEIEAYDSDDLNEWIRDTVEHGIPLEVALKELHVRA
jgi:hypothetical protein